MSKKNRQRALICNRVSSVKGLMPVREVSRRSGASTTQVADCLLKLMARTKEELCEGEARFTGNARVYLNGAVGSEIRCRTCGLTYWETGLPYSRCVDCRGTNVKPKGTSCP